MSNVLLINHTPKIWGSQHQFWEMFNLLKMPFVKFHKCILKNVLILCLERKFWLYDKEDLINLNICPFILLNCNFSSFVIFDQKSFFGTCCTYKILTKELTWLTLLSQSLNVKYLVSSHYMIPAPSNYH